MDPQTLFSLAFPLALPFWLLMILAPGWHRTRQIMSSPLVAVPPAVVYVVALIPNLATFTGPVASASFTDLVPLFGTPAGTAAVWAHLIAFDLFVGRWCYLDARDRGIHPLVMAPILILTILFAPVGFLAYLLVAAALPARVAVGSAG